MTASRAERERILAELVRERPVASQAELVRALARRGIEATQPTVSRDLKRLGLIKRPARSGGYRYDRGGAPQPRPRSELRRALREFLTSVQTAASILVLKTPAGRANALAIALDESGLEEIVATLAGDDTILVLSRDDEERQRLIERLDELR